ncbi:MAG: glycosyltransferase family 4 protein [Pirellulales bacterium]|nr:glycosyltransferase family 4 protein [Pirellulales bacterium]
MFLPSTQGGGTRHFEFARFCTEQGDQFTVIASDVSYLDGKRINRPREERIDGVNIYRVSTLAVLHRNFIWRVLAFLGFMHKSFWAGWRRTKQVDIIMGTSPSLFQAFSASMLALFRRKPFLLEIRDLWPDFAIDMGILKSRILIFFARRLEYHLYRRARHIIVNSPAYVDYLVNKGIRPEKVTLISNGVDPSMFDPEGDGTSFAKRYDLLGKFIVTYAGAIGPANDIQTIVRAAETLQDDPDIHFVLAGDGKARQEIEQLVQESKIGNVTLTGVIPKSEMADLLAASNACVATLMNIPMFKTTYPNKVFDYMAAGRPTILGIDGVIREVIEQCDGGIYVQPGDSKQFADAVRRLKADPDLCQRMGQRAREHVVRHFNRNDHARQFHRLLQNLLNN